MRPTISVIVPVYNSEATLTELINRLNSVLELAADRFEIILVNDGSRDRSWETIQKIAGQYSFVRGFNLLRNFGQHNALLCGIRNSNFELIVTLDDDLQHPPEEIPKLLWELSKNYDVVYGAPLKEPQSFIRTIMSRFVKISLKAATGIKAAENASAFRAFRTKIREAFKNYESSFVSVDVLLSWGTTRFGVVKVEHQPRKTGKSGYNLKRLFVQAVNMFTGFSAFPLHLVSAIGFCLTLVGALMLCYVLGRYLAEGGSVPGFPFLASSLAIFSGAQLFALGIIGEYLARMHFRMMDRPVYIVGEKTDSDQEILRVSPNAFNYPQ